MNPGLPSGFVQFNTLAHRILLYLHHNGPATNSILSEELANAANEPPKAVAANLFRLHTAGFINKVSRMRRPGTRSCSVYSLHNTSRGAGRSVPNLTTQQRTAEWRKRKSMLVSSVFSFRGRIDL